MQTNSSVFLGDKFYNREHLNFILFDVLKQAFSYILYGKGKYFCEYQNTLSSADITELVSVINHLHKYLLKKQGKIIYANKY